MAWFNTLKALRQGTGDTAIEAAKKLGLPYTTYSSYEQGKREPNIKTLKLLADYFGVSLDVLLDRSAEEPAKEEAEPFDAAAEFDEIYEHLSPEDKKQVDVAIENLIKPFKESR